MINNNGIDYELLTPFSPSMSDFKASSPSMDVVCGSCGQRRGSHYTDGRGITRCPIIVEGHLENPERWGAEHHNQTFVPVSKSKFHNLLDDSLFSID